jgi:hypothetical protein
MMYTEYMENWKNIRFCFALWVVLAVVVWPTISVYPRLPSYVAVDASGRPCPADCANLPSCCGAPLQCASALGCWVPPVLPATPPAVETKPVHFAPFIAYDEKSSGLLVKPEPLPPKVSA